ncbi:MAG: hypothetical protein IH621_05650 [Krumholzibacteria bacterium]|nr:hypothetical protein [Candidatus Krumholzibacteria bacterium]
MTAGDDREQILDAWLALSAPGGDFPGTVSLPLLTGSMAPAIPVGARLLIASAQRRSFGPGDVVVFARDGKLIAHRLLFALGTGSGTLYLEKGDWNPRGGLIRRRDVRGVVTGWYAPGGDGRSAVAVPRSRRAAALSVLRALKTLLRG